MKKTISLLLTIIITLCLTLACLAEPKAAPRKDGSYKVGLVLSGGGAKGIAHVGVIKALEDNDIPIDYVAGTSMGAIVGSLYSCGWSPEQMMNLFTSPDFHYWSTGTINKERVYYFSRPEPTPQWFSININPKDTTGLGSQIIPTSLVNPLPMNIEFLRLYGPYSLQCKENFNNLFVPFRCVTSDVYHKHKIVLSNGSLGDAVRASMSFPLVFRPIKIDNVLVYDGGIYDNFPVNVMEKDFNPNFIIGVSVSGADSKPIQGDMYSQLEDMIIQNNDYSVPANKGIKIQVPVLNFGVLQFDQAQTIYEIGYKTGLSMVDSIKSRVAARRPLAEVTARREKFASETPELIFDKVEVTGAGPHEANYLKFLFDKGEKHPRLDMNEVENAYYRAVTDGTLNNLLPQAEFGKDGNNTLLLEATVKKPLRLGAGGWITSSTNSMLYLQAGYHSMNLNSLNVSISGWVGQSYYAGLLDARFALRTNIPSYVQFEAVASCQKYYDTDLLFYQTSTPTFITQREQFIRGSFVWALGRRGKGYVSLAYGGQVDKYFPDNSGDYSEASKDRTRYHIGVFRAGAAASTLNDLMYPSQGYDAKANITLSHESSLYCPGGERVPGSKYQGKPRAQLEVLWKNFFPAGKHFRVGVMGNAMGTLERLNQNYTATVVHATPFAPTPSTKNYFIPAFNSDNYLAAGVIPMWIPVGSLQVRGDFYAYAPMRRLVGYGTSPAHYDGWFRRVEFIGEAAVVYNFPFASLSLYANYLSSPKNNWNFGINLGLYFTAPKLLR